MTLPGSRSIRLQATRKANERPFAVDTLHGNAWPIAILYPLSITQILPEPQREPTGIWLPTRDAPATGEPGQIEGQIEADDEATALVRNLPENGVEKDSSRQQT